MAETRIQTVKDLAASRFDWEQALRDISRAIPNDVTLTALNGSISSGATAAAAAPSAARSTLRPIALQGCTTGQKQVATLLSRLRAVDGVTRVTLTKSAKPSEAAANTAATPSAATSNDRLRRRPPARVRARHVLRALDGPEQRRRHHRLCRRRQRGRNGATAPETTTTTATTQPASGVTTPPADPAASGTATPASTPQGGDAK